MKIRFWILMGVMLLPLILTACGNKGPENAEKYIEAIADGDREEAEQYVCDDYREALTRDATLEGIFGVREVECEDDGENVVRCFFKVSDGDNEIDLSTRFLMDGDKVCGVLEEGN